MIHSPLPVRRFRRTRSWPAIESLGRSCIRWAHSTAALASLLLFAVHPAEARDRGADGKFDQRDSAHFVLLQDVDIDESGGLRGSRRFEQEVLKVLEQAYESLDDFLGLRPPRKIQVVVYDSLVFDQTFSGLFRFPAAGFYGGVICIRGDALVHQGLVHVLHHELVHAALDMARPSLAYPAWFNEGLAEWFEARALGKRHLSVGEYQYLEKNARAGLLFSLAVLDTPSFGHLPTGSAQLAYLQSYAFFAYLARVHGERSLSELTESFIRTGDLNRSFRRVYRADLAKLESRFLAEFR